MSDHPITPIRTYLLVWLVLVFGTAGTIWVAFFDLGFLNTTVALAIACTKATFVIVYFMGVRYNTPLTKVVAVAGFFWLLILFALGMSDYASRTWLGVAGR